MNVSIPEVESVWKDADCLWTAEQVERAIEAQAKAITQQLADKNPLVLVVMRGGLMYGAQLLLKLRFPLEVDYIHVTRYGRGLSGSELQWKVTPAESMENRHVLILDDILDEGLTLEAIMQACESHGAASVTSAVLVEKKHDRRPHPDFRASYTCLEVPDRYVFGYGMDYKGYLRNANGIYAVKGL
jgi:hypoxanthine phosphoribosyltransferase